MIETSFKLRTIGTHLKERRKERRLNLKQISEITKIRVEYLQAIEDSNYDVFPSEVYLKGFLKNYAKFLGINTERALAMYRREREYKDKEPTIGMTKKIRDKGINLTITPGRIIALVLVIALLMSAFYIASYIGRIFKEPEISVLNPTTLTAGSEDTVRTTEEKILIEGEVEVGSTLKINGEDFQTNNFQRFSEEFDLQPGLNRFVLVAESQFGRESELVLNVFRESGTTTPEVTGSVTPTPTVTVTVAPEGLTGELVIIDREAYVEMKTDGTELAGRVLEIGENIEFTDITKLEIFTPRPDTVQLVINGKEDTMTGTVNSWQLVNGEILKK